jgi:predicted acetyltransferase
VSIAIRRGRPDDHRAILDLDVASFGGGYDEQEAADAALEVGPEQFLVAVDETDDGRIVGIAADLDLRLSLPGGEDVPASGVTWVTVEVTHRRRGILRALLERQLREHAAAGSAASLLLAAEGGIYGRFGFGLASRFRSVVLDRLGSRLAAPADTSAVRRLATAEAADLLPDIHDRWRRRTPGAVARDDRRWQFVLLDRPGSRGGWSALNHLVHPDGYVSYRLRQDWTTGDPAFGCKLVDYAPVSDGAHAALWQTLLSMDLVSSIESDFVPVDDPLPWLLTDPRKVRTTMVRDGLWLRPLDIPALLRSRHYAVDVDVVLAVDDPLFGDGRYRLTGGPDGAECSRTDAAPDLRLPVASLGAVVAGGTRLGELARGGRVAAEDAALLQRLDRAMLADRAPAHGTFF